MASANQQQPGIQNDPASLDLELKKLSTKDRQKYDKVAKYDDTVEVEEDLAISMEHDDPRLTAQEEAKDGGSNDSDDIDADLDALEQSVQGDDIDTDEDEEDGDPVDINTDFDNTAKKRSSTITKFAEAHATIRGRQLLKQTEEEFEQDDDGVGAFDTQQQITIEDSNFETEDADEEATGSASKSSASQKGEKATSSSSSSTGGSKRSENVVEQSTRAYQENPRPRRLGKMWAFCYNKKNKPRIVIGPDWGFSFLELALTNGVIGMVLKSAINQNALALFSLGLTLLTAHNIAFMLTICWNQGLPPRDPNAHSQGYLNKVKTIEPTKFCQDCKTISRKDVYTEHCTFCEYCVEDLDHHCPWSSKCIGKGNMLCFKIFLSALTACLIFAFVGGGIVLSSGMTGHAKVHTHHL